MTDTTKVFNKEELIWALEIMYSFKAGTSEFGKCSVAFLERLYYGNIQNGMRTNELASKEAAQRTRIIEQEAEIAVLNRKLKRATNALRRMKGN